jgi:hypothetical protein
MGAGDRLISELPPAVAGANIAWAARDVIGERLTLEVVATVQHYGRLIVTANVDGLFENRGLPDPLEADPK